MRNAFKTAATLALSLGFAGAAVAQQEIDTNGDGVYSYDEMLAAFPDMTEENFIAIDSNGDGLIDPAEYDAAKEAGLIVTDS